MISHLSHTSAGPSPAFDPTIFLCRTTRSRSPHMLPFQFQELLALSTSDRSIIDQGDSKVLAYRWANSLLGNLGAISRLSNFSIALKATSSRFIIEMHTLE